MHTQACKHSTYTHTYTQSHTYASSRMHQHTRARPSQFPQSNYNVLNASNCCKNINLFAVVFVGYAVPMAIRVIQNFVDYYIFCLSFLFAWFFASRYFWIYFCRFGGKFQFCHVSADVCHCKPHKGNRIFHAAWKMHASAAVTGARAVVKVRKVKLQGRRECLS